MVSRERIMNLASHATHVHAHAHVRNALTTDSPRVVSQYSQWSYSTVLLLTRLEAVLAAVHSHPVLEERVERYLG